jgi:UDP-N-acetyl-D-glucosamine dehydrogenase
MALLERIEGSKAAIGIVGLGYVGLPLAAAFAERGFSVTAFESDAARAAALRAGRSYVPDVSSERLKPLVRAGVLRVAKGPADFAAQDVVVFCVQTPWRKTQEPDMGPLVSAATAAARHLKRGSLVIVESTTWPGATEEILRPVLEASGLRAGRDFHLAFSPERIDPGNPRYGLANTPKVVGGLDVAATKQAAALYSKIVERVVPVSSARAAELVKLLENSFRAVNIALVSEIARICRALRLDVWEVIAAAATKPFGFMPFYPGPGIGGHCIPKDPKLLAWKMKSLNFEARMVELASAINAAMPQYAVERLTEALNDSQKPLKGSRVLILGVAYKPGVPDTRESPAIDVMTLLWRAGAKVFYHDPFVPAVEAGGRRLKSVGLTAAVLSRADAVAILTAHPDVDYELVFKRAKILFDARNALPKRKRPGLYRL